MVEPTNEVEKKYKKDGITSMSIIVDSIKDHLIPYILKLNTSKKMYDALNDLYIVNNIGQVMSLRNEICDIRMKNNDILTSYFVRISQLRDQLQAIDQIFYDKELVTLAKNGLPHSWDLFATVISNLKEAPSLEELHGSCA